MIFVPIPSSATTAFAELSNAHDPFDESPLNPVNMSRTSARHTHDSAPSSILLELVRKASIDLAELASVQSGWRFVTEKNNVTIYEMNGGKASDYYMAKGVTTVNVGVDHVLSLLTTPATDSFALRMNQIFGKHYQDGVVIDHLSFTSPPTHFQPRKGGAARSYSEDDAYAVNWVSLKAASIAERNRDFTITSYQDTYQWDATGKLVRLGRRAARDPLRRGDASRRLLGVHALSSFDFADIPELPKTQYTERLHFHNTGFVVEETHEPGVVRLSFFVSLLPVPTTLRSPKKYEKWLQTLALCAGNLALQTMPVPVPVTTCSTTDSGDWKKKCDHCLLCLKSFHTFRRCHHCRFCGEAICTKCSGFVDLSRFPKMVQMAVLDKSSASTNQGLETRGCTRCIQQLEDDAAHANGSVLPAEGSATDRKMLAGPHGMTVRTNNNNPLDDDDLASLFSGSSSDRPSYDSFYGHHTASDGNTNGNVDGNGNGVPGKRCHGDQYDTHPPQQMPDEIAPSSSQATFRWAKPRHDPTTNHSSSVSTVSTSFSNPSFADDRNHQLRMSVRQSQVVANATQVQPFHQVYYSEDHEHQQHDDEMDIDAVPLLADSMSNLRSTTSSKCSHGSDHSSASRQLPPRSTATSRTNRVDVDTTFKFSMMRQGLPLSSEPETEPHVAVESDSGNHHPIGQSHSVYQKMARSTSSSGSSRTSVPSTNDMIVLPRPGPTPAPPKSASEGVNGDEEHNDMILLTPKPTQLQQFVVLSGSRRPSTLARPADGSDMIPLQFVDRVAH